VDSTEFYIRFKSAYDATPLLGLGLRKLLTLLVLVLIASIPAFLVLDVDGDGYSNYEELRRGWNPLGVTDKDGDGLIDEVEVTRRIESGEARRLINRGLFYVDNKDGTITFLKDPNPEHGNPSFVYWVENRNPYHGLKFTLKEYEELFLYRLDEDGILDNNEKILMDFLISLPLSERKEIATKILQDGLSPEEASVIGYLSSFDRDVMKCYLKRGIDDSVVELVNIASSLEDKEFVEWLIRQKMGIEDGKIDEIEREFYRNPGKELIEELFKHYVKELRRKNPEVAEEVEKLPDIKDGVSMKEVEAVEDIMGMCEDEIYQQAVQSMLSEGIKEKRKYCTPLEAALWIFKDKEVEEVDELLKDYDVREFVGYAWRESSTSANYSSDKWDKFEEVVDRLNSPVLLCVWWGGNVDYFCDNKISPPEIVFRRKTAECADAAVFAAYVLEKNGFDAKIVDMWFTTISEGNINYLGHATCCVKLKDKLYSVDQGRIYGPFKTYEDIANYYKGSIAEYYGLPLSTPYDYAVLSWEEALRFWK